MNGLGARQSALGTAVQVLPQLRQVLLHLKPTWHLHELAELSEEFVARHSISGLIWDVDGTLTDHHADQLSERSQQAFATLTRMTLLRHAILSNAGENRFQELGRVFPRFPIHKGYRIGNQLILRTRVGEEDSWNARELATRLADGAIPIRKPNADLVQLVVAAMGRAPAEVVMVGDQYLTDIAGANLAGIRSIKLPTIARDSFPLAVRLGQRAEDLIYRLQYGAPDWEATPTAVATPSEGR